MNVSILVNLVHVGLERNDVSLVFIFVGGSFGSFPLQFSVAYIAEDIQSFYSRRHLC